MRLACLLVLLVLLLAATVRCDHTAQMGTPADGSTAGSEHRAAADGAAADRAAADRAARDRAVAPTGRAWCDQYLSCLGVVAPLELGKALATYGAQGSCFQQGSDATCMLACYSGMLQLRPANASLWELAAGFRTYTSAVAQKCPACDAPGTAQAQWSAKTPAGLNVSGLQCPWDAPACTLDLAAFKATGSMIALCTDCRATGASCLAAACDRTPNFDCGPGLVCAHVGSAYSGQSPNQCVKDLTGQPCAPTAKPGNPTNRLSPYSQGFFCERDSATLRKACDRSTAGGPYYLAQSCAANETCVVFPADYDQYYVILSSTAGWCAAK